MKKTIFLLVIAGFLTACTGNVKEAEEPTVTKETEALQKTSEDVMVESESLESRADSLLNNL